MKQTSQIPWTIRAATTADIQTVVDILDGAYPGDYTYLDEVARDIETGKSHTLLAEWEDGTPAATASLYVDDGGRTAKYARAAVLPEFRGTGLFHDLHERRKAIATVHMPALEYTDAVTEHAKTQHVYGHRGFTPVAVRAHREGDKYGNDRHDSVVLMAAVEPRPDGDTPTIHAPADADALARYVIDQIYDDSRQAVRQGDRFDGAVQLDVAAGPGPETLEVVAMPADDGITVETARDRLARYQQDHASVELLVDANTPLAAELATDLPGYQLSGFVPRFSAYEGGDRDMFHYAGFDTDEHAVTMASDRLQFTQDTLDLLGYTELWNDHPVRPHPRVDGVYEMVFTGRT